MDHTQKSLEDLVKSLPASMVAIEEVPPGHQGYKTLVAALDDVKPTPEGRNVMYIMTPQHGDIKITWDPNNADEVEHAKRTFNDLRGKRFAAHRVADTGKPAELTTAFDASDRALIFRPASVGG